MRSLTAARGRIGRRLNLEASAGLLTLAAQTGWSRAEILSLPRTQFDTYLALLDPHDD